MSLPRPARVILLMLAALALIAAGCAANDQVVVTDEQATVDIGTAGEGDAAVSDEPAEEPAAATATDDIEGIEEDVADVPGDELEIDIDFGDPNEPAGSDGEPERQEEVDPVDEPVGITVEPVSGALAVAEAADRVDQAQSYRIDMRMGVEMRLGPIVDVDIDLLDESDPPFVQGSVAGGAQHLLVDMGGFAAALGEDLGVDTGIGDVNMEAIATSEAFYVRGSLLAEPALGLDLDADQWGRVDLTGLGLGDLLGDANPFQTADPEAMVALIRSVDGVRELGAGTVRGVPTTIYAADVTLEQLMQAQGIDDDALGEMFGTSGPGSAVAAADFLDQAATYEIHLDAEGLVRRLTMNLDMSGMFEAILESDQMAADLFDGTDVAFAITSQMDLYDYGAAIAIDVPANAVDITDEFLATRD